MIDILPNGLSPGVARLLATGVMLHRDPFANACARLRELYDFPDNWVISDEDAAEISDRIVKILPYLDPDESMRIHAYYLEHQPVYRAWCMAQDPEVSEAMKIAAE